MSLWRHKALLGSFLFLGVLIIFRLFYWQIILKEELLAQAESQHFIQQEILAPRGQILASDDFPLVTNQEAYLVYADLSQLNFTLQEVVSRLAPLFAPSKENLEQKEQELREKLGKRDLVWVPLAKKVERETKKQIENFNIAGLGFKEEGKRLYPEGSLSAHLLGFVGQDASGRDKGYFGLEGFYERLLSGEPGLLRREKDASGRPILIGKTRQEEAVPGGDLKLHLSRAIQFMVEEKLKEGLEKYGAKAGSVVILDPQTGGVLAMASLPSYDPTNYAQEDEGLFPNPVVAQTFEPGSIFKVLVMAAALEEGVVKPQDLCPCSGSVTIGEYTIKTWDDKYHPDSSMIEILQYSDNVGMVFVGEKLGKEKLVWWLERFGIGQQTGIDLEEETTQPLRPAEKWSRIDLATASFGQGVAVTPIQMVRAVAAIANGGRLLEPHVVAKIKTATKEIFLESKMRREVISSVTARMMTEMMVNAVEKGEAKWAKPKDYRIAGKTGTAQIPIAGHYDQEKTIASFVGFAPADNPRFVMLVTLREPTSSPWGSETAAPLWFEIAKELFFYLGILP